MSRPILLLICLVALCTPSSAVDEVFATDQGAIRGYDPVAYFTAGEAVKGDPAHAMEWNGATWHFASAENRARFEAEPAAYAPRFGGYCAYGTSQGYKVGIDPDAFSIVDGRLYLNYNRSVQSTWLKDTAGYIRLAEENWVELEHQAYDR